MKTYIQNIHGFFTIGALVIPNDNSNSDFIKMNQEVAEGEAEIIVQTKSLEQIKAEKVGEIDNKTDQLILAGITHETLTFGITLEKQITALGLLSARQAGADMAGKKYRANNATYTFSSTADFDAWFNTAFGRVETLLISGSELKDSVAACVDVAAVDAIVDSRT